MKERISFTGIGINITFVKISYTDTCRNSTNK